jgi:Fe2+ transport system protein FeoA
MDKVSINKLKNEAKFIIQKISLDKFQKLKLMELGILPKIQMQLLHNTQFGSIIIKCNGSKYAIDSRIAQKIFIDQIAV